MGETLLALPLWFLAGALAILGAIWGSFAGALCSRWPAGESVARGRSRCAACGRNIAAYDLLPLFSYIWLRGKCRNCAHHIGTEIFVIELLGSSIGIISVLLLPAPQALAAAIFGWILLPLVILDARHLWLPDRLILLLALAGVVAGPMLMPGITATDRLIGGAIGYGALETIRHLYRYIRKREGMGAGDAKFFGSVGLWLGWQSLPVTLLLASLLGLAWAVLSVPSRENGGPVLPGMALPFGSFLGLAGLLIAWFL